MDVSPVTEATETLCSSTHHHHSPLASADSIRLLRVEAATENSRPSTYSLTTSPLDNAAKLNYHALSYTWGDTASICFLDIDGKVLHVTKNLHDFLRVLHRQRWHGYLWVDALCIDQSNIAERNSQVEMMAEIYRRANTVHAWLGTGESGLRDCLRFIAAHGSLRGHKFTDDRFLGRMAFCAYWKRAWIVQELTCATDIVLHYADQSIKAVDLWDNFFDTSTFKEWFVEDVKQTSPNIQRMFSILRRTQPNPDPELQPFESIIHDFSGQLATEPRDHIYAFRSLYQKHVGQIVPVEYCISLSELVSRSLRCCETKTNLHSLFTILYSWRLWECSKQELDRDAGKPIVARLCPQLPNPFLPVSGSTNATPRLRPSFESGLELACTRGYFDPGSSQQKRVFLPSRAVETIRRTEPSTWCVALLDADYDLMVYAGQRSRNGERPYSWVKEAAGIALVAHTDNVDNQSRVTPPAVGIWVRGPHTRLDGKLSSSLRRLEYFRKTLENAFQTQDGVVFGYPRRSEISIGMSLRSWLQLSYQLRSWEVECPAGPDDESI